MLLVAYLRFPFFCVLFVPLRLDLKVGGVIVALADRRDGYNAACRN